MTFAMQNSEGGTRVLVIDADNNACKTWRWMLPKQTFAVSTALDFAQAEQLVLKAHFDLAIVDWPLFFAELDRGLQLMQKAHCAWLATVASDALADAAQALKAGACDYVTKPFTEIELCVQKLQKAAQMKQLSDENASLHHQMIDRTRSPFLESQSLSMQPLIAKLHALMQNDAPFLLVGPPGLQKPMIARAMHDHRPIKGGSFVALMGELADEAAMFGPMGVVRRVDKGCLLICNVERLDLSLQERIAGLILERKGKSSPPRKESIFRLCATSCWSLQSMQDQHRISPSMLALMQQNELQIPPLSARREDIQPFVYAILHRLAPHKVMTVDQDCMKALTNAPWRGQLLELEQILGQALLHCTGNALKRADLPSDFEPEKDLSAAVPHASASNKICIEIDLDQPFRDAQVQADCAFRSAYLQGLLDKAGSVSAAAREAQMDRANFRRLLKKYLGQ